MDDAKVHAESVERNEEDYTGAVCWLIWNRKSGAFDTRQALVDVEDFERLFRLPWRIQKVGKLRYPRVVFNNAVENVYLAREVMGHPPGLVVDHINRNTLDDRRKNLRACTVRENNLNTIRNTGRASRFKGVYWSMVNNRWAAVGHESGRRKSLGFHPTEVEAARAYNSWARERLGPTAYLNPV